LFYFGGALSEGLVAEAGFFAAGLAAAAGALDPAFTIEM
jgi:hypothetical protein